MHNFVVIGWVYLHQTTATLVEFRIRSKKRLWDGRQVNWMAGHLLSGPSISFSKQTLAWSLEGIELTRNKAYAVPYFEMINQSNDSAVATDVPYRYLEWSTVFGEYWWNKTVLCTEHKKILNHYGDIIWATMVSQITGNSSVCWIHCQG